VVLPTAAEDTAREGASCRRAKHRVHMDTDMAGGGKAARRAGDVVGGSLTAVSKTDVQSKCYSCPIWTSIGRSNNFHRRFDDIGAVIDRICKAAGQKVS
jgi:hypothetical protein